MQFWLGMLGAVLVALGVLGVAQQSNLAVYANWLTTTSAQICLFVGILLPLIVIWWVNLPNRLADKTLKTGIIAGLMCLFWLMVGIRTLSFAAQFDKVGNQLADNPQTIIATVQITQISDSLYDNVDGKRFRQQATITNIRPAVDNKINQLPQIANPFFNQTHHAAQQAFAKQTAPLPDNLTVLLTATPPKNLNKNKELSDDPLLALNKLKAGEQVQMTLSLSKLVADNSQAFDIAKYYKTRHIHANAKILAVDWQTHTAMTTSFWQKPLLVLERWRWAYRQAFLQNFYKNQATEDNLEGSRQGAAVVLSLLTGDRALIDGETKALYQLAGIMHLLAISGTHILFLAMVINGIATSIIGRFFANLYRKIDRPMLSFVIMASIASSYALFTGFEIPAVRTVLMLVAVGVCRQLLVEWSAWRILASVGLLLAVFDPFVLWQAGFWLSFVAVGLLMSYDKRFEQYEGVGAFFAIKHQVIALIKLQTYLFFAMLPISLLLFGKVSWLGLFVNLFAVGLFGWVVVPISLIAGVLYPIVPSLAVGLWGVLATMLGGLADGFGTLQTLFVNPYLTMPIGIGAVLLSGLVLVALKSPLPNRLVALPVLALIFVLKPVKTSNGVEIYSLSVQGLSANLVAKQDGHWLIVHETSPKLTTDYHKELLKTQLTKFGVKTLAGVVVQTNNRNLAKVVGQLSLEMPIKELWWAGAGERFGTLHARRCGAGVQMDGDFMAMTGWGQIENDDMHACAVWLTVDMPMKLDKVDYPTTNVVFDVGQNEHLWRLWALMCRDDNKPINPAIIGEHRNEAVQEVLGFY